jgi:hypothetical protein
LLGTLKITLEMMKPEHTIFALPLAFIGAAFAAQELPNAARIGRMLLVMLSDLSRVNTAFFTIKGRVSVSLPVTTVIEILRH